MRQPNIQTDQKTVKAAHIYQVVGSSVVSNTIAGKKFHFIGAGGVGMNGLAALLMKNKAIVTGSDQMQTSAITKLNQSGADIKIGHKTENLNLDTNTVVYSAAIRENNPELQTARKKGCQVKKYAQMLGELMDCYDGIAIAGTHGKSTTSGWLVYLLKQAGLNPNFIVGADITQLSASSGTGDSRIFIAEACEYDRSFINLRPKIACILNIEADHLDYYRDEDDIIDAFVQFALGVKNDGIIIANGEDPNIAKLIKRTGNYLRFETFGFGRQCNFSVQNIELKDGLYSFDIFHNSSPLGKANISLSGKHNILNALAVLAIAVNAGVDASKAISMLSGFCGMDRRLMFKEKIAGVTILDDYAHHPTEIRASLAAMRQRYQPNRIWCIFQPHQYSRTRFLLDDFAESFKLADITIVPEIYFVRDTQETKSEVNSEMLVKQISSNGTDAVFIDGFATICEYLKKNVTSGDLVVTMGAGDIWKVADEYIQWLRKNS